MRKKKKQWSSCTPQYNQCKPCKPCEPCNPCDSNKKYSCEDTNHCEIPKPKYVECGCDHYEITCVDKCVNLSKKAEELFEKALKCENKATDAFDQAKECEKSAKILAAKADKLLKTANCSEKEAKEAECMAKELMEKAEKLCHQAKCLYKEGEMVEKQAEDNCEKAKNLYEQAHEYNEKAKDLYTQAMKCDEKALECYKTAGEKIKEYEMKSNKCKEMIKKCNHKLDHCESKPMCPKYVHTKEYMMCEDLMDDCYTSCGCKKEEYDYSCNPPKKKMCKKPCHEKVVYKPNKCHKMDDMMYMDCHEEKGHYCEDLCSQYVEPMYDMYPMQHMGGFMDQYPTMDMPCMDQYQNMNDMWMNYYMMMQNMMMQNMMPYNKM